jgi:hypothetical protein
VNKQNGWVLDIKERFPSINAVHSGVATNQNEMPGWGFVLLFLQNALKCFAFLICLRKGIVISKL